MFEKALQQQLVFSPIYRKTISSSCDCPLSESHTRLIVEWQNFLTALGAGPGNMRELARDRNGTADATAQHVAVNHDEAYRSTTNHTRTVTVTTTLPFTCSSQQHHCISCHLKRLVAPSISFHPAPPWTHRRPIGATPEPPALDRPPTSPTARHGQRGRSRRVEPPSRRRCFQETIEAILSRKMRCTRQRRLHCCAPWA